MAKAAAIEDVIARKKAEADIEQKYATISRHRAEEEARQKVDETKGKIDAESGAGVDIEARLAAARAKASKLGTEDQVNERLRIEQERLAAIQADRRKHEDRLEELERKRLDPTDTEWHERNHLRTIVESDKDTEQKQQGYVNRLKGMHKGQVDDIRAANEEVSDLEGQLKGIVGRIRSLQQELRTQQAGAGFAAQGAISADLAGAGLNPFSKAGASFVGAINAEEAVGMGRTLNQQQTQSIAHATAALKAAGVQQKEIVDLLRAMQDLHVSHADKLTEIFGAMERVKQRMNHLERTKAF